MTEAPMHMRRTGFDPLPELSQLREAQPISKVDLRFGGAAWLVTRYEDVRQVLGDLTTFSNEAPPRPGLASFQDENGNRDDGFLLGYDPPHHTRLRKMLTKEFTVRRMRRLEPRVETIVTEHLDAIEKSGPPADLVADFALPVPSLVISELLGVPYEDRDEFQLFAAQRVDETLPQPERDASILRAREYAADLVARQRANPGDDLVGMLVREHGDDITDRELAGMVDLLLLAGHETTANMLGVGTLLLLTNPEQAAEVRAGRLVDEAVEEMLRYLSIVHSVFPRTARHDTVLSGQQINAGDVLLCSLPAANRDPGLGDDPDRFDITRKIAAHMAFGHGLHHCIGAPLARMEMRIAFPALLRRFPNLASAVPFDEVEFRTYSSVFGLQSLPITW